MPIADLGGSPTNQDIINKVNELVDFANSIQKAGTGSYMVWIGPDATVPSKPMEDSNGGV